MSDWKATTRSIRMGSQISEIPNKLESSERLVILERYSYLFKSTQRAKTHDGPDALSDLQNRNKNLQRRDV